MNLKALLPIVVACLLALVIYNLFIAGLINKYDASAFDGKSHFDRF